MSLDGGLTDDSPPGVRKPLPLLHDRSAGDITAATILTDEGTKISVRDDPDRWRRTRVTNSTVVAYEHDEVGWPSLLRDIVRRPVIGTRDALHLDRDGPPTSCDEDVDGLLVAEGKRCLRAEPVKARQDEEFRREVCVVAGQVRLLRPKTAFARAVGQGVHLRLALSLPQGFIYIHHLTALSESGADVYNHRKLTMTQSRPKVPESVQTAIYFRDGWLCHVCRRPVIFHLALKYLQNRVEQHGFDPPPAYWHPNWRRDAAPLLDELGASIDHIVPYADGGAHKPSNFAAICARCNARKSTKDDASFREELRPWRVCGKHGEPTRWDGFSSLFVTLARENRNRLTKTEKSWLGALEQHFDGNASTG